MKRIFLLYAVCIGGLVGCAPDEPLDPQDGTIHLDFSHYVDGVPLQMHNTHYVNGAGNQYRVTRLQYFISGVELFRDGELLYTQESEPQTVNAEWTDARRVTLDDVPPGRVDSIRFAYGVVPEYNHTYDFLLPSADIHMYWSAAMGGGYHFMKLEGHWIDGDAFGGYAFHIGYNDFLLRVGLPVDLTIPDGGPVDVSIAMNVNEWFDNPHQFDLKAGGGYTMGDTVLMNNLVENGSHAFTIQH